MGTPREFGDVVCFLASERAAYVTGTTVLVDGGSSRVAAVKRLLTPAACWSLGLVLLAVVARAADRPVERLHLPARPCASGRAARAPCRAARTRRAAASTSSTWSCGRRRCSSGSSAACTTAPTSTRPRRSTRPASASGSAASIDLQDMHRSQQIAAAVALRAAGKKVVAARRSAPASTSSSRASPRSGSSSPTT